VNSFLTINFLEKTNRIREEILPSEELRRKEEQKRNLSVGNY